MHDHFVVFATGHPLLASLGSTCNASDGPIREHSLRSLDPTQLLIQQQAIRRWMDAVVASMLGAGMLGLLPERELLLRKARLQRHLPRGLEQVRRWRAQARRLVLHYRGVILIEICLLATMLLIAVMVSISNSAAGVVFPLKPIAIVLVVEVVLAGLFTAAWKLLPGLRARLDRLH